MSYEIGVLYVPPTGPVPRAQVMVPWVSPPKKYDGQTVPWSTASFLKGLAGVEEYTAPCRQHVRRAAARMRQVRGGILAAGDESGDAGGSSNAGALARDAALPRLLEMTTGEVAARSASLLPKILQHVAAGAQVDFESGTALGDVEARIVDGALTLAVHDSATACKVQESAQSAVGGDEAKQQTPRGFLLLFLAPGLDANSGIVSALCRHANVVDELLWGVVPLLPAALASSSCAAAESAPSSSALLNHPVYEPSHGDLQVLKVCVSVTCIHSIGVFSCENKCVRIPARDRREHAAGLGCDERQQPQKSRCVRVQVGLLPRRFRAHG